MRALKSTGGITRGCGITDSTLDLWIHALPLCIPLCNALDIHDRWATCRRTRIKPEEGQQKRAKVPGLDWSTFPIVELSRLISLSSGIVADNKLIIVFFFGISYPKCDKALEVGIAAMNNVIGNQWQICINKVRSIPYQPWQILSRYMERRLLWMHRKSLPALQVS